uniref:Uncharacterized protein n=1 Tax=Oryza rufipogon TaxID=4529 RepID=A0A0E0MQU5_ORYRU
MVGPGNVAVAADVPNTNTVLAGRSRWNFYLKKEPSPEVKPGLGEYWMMMDPILHSLCPSRWKVEVEEEKTILVMMVWRALLNIKIEKEALITDTSNFAADKETSRQKSQSL